MTDERLILLNENDNCVVVAANLPAGTVLDIDGVTTTLDNAVSIGHKLARHALVNQEKVIKYGAVIGHVIRDVRAGDHLHVHNMVSDYIATYTHEDGGGYVKH